jgi:gluconate 2-dehydrogenase alpha chain
VWYGAILPQGVVIDEWVDDSFDHSGLGFIGGASMTINTEKHPIASAGGSTWGQTQRNWGSEWKRWIHQNTGRTVSSAYIQTNSFPYETTFLDLDPEVKDTLRDPVIRVTTMTRENERRAALHAQDKME